VKVNGSATSSGEMVVMQRTAGMVRIESTKAQAQVLLLGGQPLGEPVVRYGPFVMNTKQEIVDAVQEYNDGTLVKVGKKTL